MNEKTLEEARQLMAGYLKQRRIELKLSQQEVADRTGLARKTINAMEAGKFWLGMKQYLLICEALRLFPSIAKMEIKDVSGSLPCWAVELLEALKKNAPE